MSRVVLVTGGSRGIGLASAAPLPGRRRPRRRHLQNGAARSPRESPARRRFSPSTCDVDDPVAVEAAFAAVEAELGPVEVLVSAAGVTDDGLVLRMSEERWSRVIETDLTANFRTVKRALGPMLKARAGRVILISSVVAYLGNAGQANYAAAKAGQIGLARSLAREVASRSVTVNVVTPGLVATDMLGGPQRRPDGGARLARAARADRRARRGGRGGALPRLGRGRLHHRDRPGSRRRTRNGTLGMVWRPARTLVLESQSDRSPTMLRGASRER